jgi:hypothetical protein
LGLQKYIIMPGHLLIFFNRKLQLPLPQFPCLKVKGLGRQTGVESWCLVGTQYVWADEKVLEVDSGYGCTKGEGT